MSYVSINRIDAASGEVSGFGEVRNAMAGAMWIWIALDERYTGRGYSFGASPACWKLACAGGMSDRDCLVCAFTFDGAWVVREHLPALADALDSFFAEHGEGVNPTVPGIAAALRELAADEAARGACFQQTSVTSDPWWLHGETEEDEGRAFTFGVDEKNADGREPFEVWERFGPEALAARRAEVTL